MSTLFGDTAVVVRAPFVTDVYGNESAERDWQTATRTTLRRVSVQPDASAEEDGDRSAVTTGWRLLTRRGVDADIVASDRVEFDGMTLEVDGEVGRYRMRGRVHHVEARLKRVTG